MWQGYSYKLTDHGVCHAWFTYSCVLSAVKHSGLPLCRRFEPLPAKLPWQPSWLSANRDWIVSLGNNELSWVQLICLLCLCLSTSQFSPFYAQVMLADLSNGTALHYVLLCSYGCLLYILLIPFDNFYTVSACCSHFTAIVHQLTCFCRSQVSPFGYYVC